jgi:hypothetical protein
MFGCLPPQARLWAWYAFLVIVCAAGNLTLLAVVWRCTDAKDEYGKWMKYLAVPWVVECAWRSVFPSLYLQRYAFWDTPLNSIIVDRNFACVGELAFQVQVCLALRQVDRDIARATGRSPRCWIQGSANLSVMVYVAAECMSYYNTATTNEWFAALEVFTDASAYVVIFPALVYLFCQCPGKILESGAKIYLLVMSLYCVILSYFNFTVDVPMYLKRYAEEQANHKKYFEFFEGLRDAAVRRVVTRKYEDWNEDMFWMVVYFSAGAWLGIALMLGPRLRSARDDSRAVMMSQILDDDVSLATNEEIRVEMSCLHARLGLLQQEAVRRAA